MPGDAPQVLVLAGPGERPDGWRDVMARHAARLGVEVAWAEPASAADAATVLGRADAAWHAVVVLAGDLDADAGLAAAVAASRVPVAHAGAGDESPDTPVARACDLVLRNRGRRSYSGALRWAVAWAHHPGRTLPYGPQPTHVGDLRRPQGTEPAPVAVLLHGGFWLDPWQRDLMDGMVGGLTAAGWATWNVEYHRMGPTGGTWETTLADACAATDALADVAPSERLDLSRVVLVGHSAGAALAAYAAARPALPGDAPGRPPRVHPVGVASLAGLVDLEAAAGADLGAGAVAAFLGPVEAWPARLARSSPVRLVPLGVPTLLVHGRDDAQVPADQSQRYARRARAVGDRVDLVLVDDDHFEVVEPDGQAAEVVLGWLATMANPGAE